MFFTYLRRELRRRRKAALVVASGLALGIALVIVVDSVTAGMRQAQSQVLQSLYGLGTDMTVTRAAGPPGEGDTAVRRPRFEFDASEEGGEETRQSRDVVMVQGFQTLAFSTVGQVSGQDGVAEAVGGLNVRVMKVSGEFTSGRAEPEQPGQRQPGGEGRVRGGGAAFDVASFSVYGTDVEHLGLGPLTTSAITSGRGFTSADSSADVAVVDSAYAKEHELAAGGVLEISGAEFTVVGIATATGGDAAADVYLPLARTQELADAQDKVTTVYVRAVDSRQIDEVKAVVQKNVPGTTVTTSEDLAETVSGSLTTASDLATGIGRWLSVVVLAAAFLVAGLLTSSAVSRRVREFGTLKALGWRSGRVIRQVVGEALVNGLVGGALGIALGVACAWAVGAFGPTLTARLGGGAAAGRGPGGPGGDGLRQTAGQAVDVALTAPVSLTAIVLAVGLAAAGGLVAGGFGGWRAARLRPADALRRVT
ncbi:ABC transporter permease [Streptomyces sp. MUM 203J]|uniref:ABC transporter permease n=1 Tax=Streptomyces sp. MUM 203J TaxID=2791990 RepID=UPI001F037EEE|nr:ABC transporter permease [Streptomyces sp. MUM 203J]MCH0541210.1 ABC transporter permease [Streptomyces sp. MUM 203J]